MGSLRIIAGDLKGRRLPVPDRPGVRPTPDRVREALFSILGDSVRGARVLDAYAGSGALGLEACSRGASLVIFLEADREVHLALDRTLASLGIAGRCRAVLGRGDRLPGRIIDEAPFDLVLGDPPYGAEEGPRFLEAASRAGLVAPGGRLVLEREAADPAAGGEGTGFRLVRTARYGRTALDFYLPAAGPGPRPA